MKHKLLTFVSILTGLLFISSGMFFIHEYEPRLKVNLGEEFEVNNTEQVVYFKDINAQFRVTEFHYHPCSGVCFWSGLAVYWEFTYEGIPYTISAPQQKNKEGNQNPYYIQMIDTDYQTYARFKVQHYLNYCNSLGKATSSCLIRGGEMGNLDWCENLNGDDFAKNLCIDNVAKVRKDPTLCNLITIKGNYCLPFKAKEMSRQEIQSNNVDD